MVNSAFYDFALFGPSPLTVCINCSFYMYIFAVLLPDLSRLFCHFVQRMFLKMNMRHQAHKPVTKCNDWGPIFETEWSRGSNCVSVPKFRGDRSNGRRAMAIFRLFKMAAAAVLDF